MNPSIRRLGKPVLAVAAVLLLLSGFAWLALPGLLQSQAEKFIADKSGHRLSMARPEIHPLSLSLRLRELKLDDPEGEPLLAFRELLIDLSASSLTRRSWVFDAIDVDGLDARLVLRDGASGPLNWSRLLAVLAPPQTAAPAAPLPRIDIARLHLGGAQFDLADRRAASPFTGRIEAVDLELNELSTLPDASGRFKLNAKTSFGATLDWQGKAALNPLTSSGKIRLDGIDLARLAPLLKRQLPPELGLAPPQGIASLSADYRLGQIKGEGKLDFVLDQLGVKLAALKLQKPEATGAPLLTVDAVELRQGRFDLAAQSLDLGPLALRGARLETSTGSEIRDELLLLPEMTLASARIDLGRRTAKLGAIALNGGKLRARRDAQGRIDLVDMFQALAPRPAASTTTAAKPSPAWSYRIERASLAGFTVAARDEGVKPAAEFLLEDIDIALEGISEKLDAPLPVKAGLRVASGGKLGIEGTLIPATAALELQLKLDDLLLKPAQPYLGQLARLDIVGGRLAAEGRLVRNDKISSYRGSFSLRELHLNEAGTELPFLAWKALSSRQIELTPARLDINELTLSGLDTELIIAKDKSTNFKRILLQQDATPAPAPASAPAFLVNVDRLRFYNGTLDFADNSLLLPFGTRIHNLRGSLGGLSSRPGSPGQLELDGEVDDYGLARAVGHVDLFNPTQFMDLKVIFRNVEMTRLTPYVATFAGRRIDSGKLSLNLQYSIKKRQLQSENQVIMDRLVLGERVASPSAKDLPLDLAVALLQDADGRIDLGLPVSGSLDDPQFSYGELVWKAIGNLLGKIVTAPFRALGALFGGGEKMASIAFDAGSQRLTPPEREKLVHLAAALTQRPALVLSVHGTWGEADREALQDLQLRRVLLEKSGFRGDTRGDPGPVSTYQPQIQKALESLFSERLGSAELAALKEGFRAANPGQLEESAAGRMMSRLSGMFRSQRVLDASEVDALKGTDFHGVLYLKLRATEAVAQERLLQLARARGEAAMAALKAASAPADRVKLNDPLRIAGADSEIPLTLQLGTGD